MAQQRKRKKADLADQIQKELSAREPERRTKKPRSRRKEEEVEITPLGAEEGGEIFIGPFARRGLYHPITNFFRQIVLLVEAGVPLLRSLRTTAGRTGSGTLGRVVDGVADSVEGGNTFWQGLSKHPQLFPDILVNLVKAGEASGNLTTVLQRVVDYRDKMDALRKKIIGALLYPLAVVLFAVAVIALFAGYVLPVFEEMFYNDFDMTPEQMGSLTTTVFAIAGIFRSGVFWIITVGIAVGLFLLYQFYSRTPAGRLTIDRLKLHIPIVKSISQRAAVVEFATTLSMLLNSGISILIALDLTRESMNNKAFANVLADVRDSVEGGEGVEAPLRRHEADFPPIVTDMLATGEESGSLDTITQKVGEIYERELDQAAEALSATIQPVVLILLGVVVIILAAALFGPYVTIIAGGLESSG